MKNVNVSADKHSFPELISQVTERGERIVVEQEGKAIAAIITYADLKRLEVLETLLLKKAELEEYEWLKNAIRNPAFDSLNDPEEDIYTLADGKPFHDPEWTKIAST
jgi:PHD/YefM family antitoxin component YafN of YafNO toxin-antitoxin module